MFVIYIVALDAPKLAMLIHFSRTLMLAAFQQNKAPLKILPEYGDYTDVFSLGLVIELPKNTGINKYVIDLFKDKQPFYGAICSLGLVELEILKVYLKTHLKTGFIWLSTSPARVLIFFYKKSDSNLHLYVNYQDLNKLIIKNRYVLLLIGKCLAWLGYAKQFTQLDFINIYHRMRI